MYLSEQLSPSCERYILCRTPSRPPEEKKYFLLKLVAPRPTFASDITDAELEVMQEDAPVLSMALN